MLAVHQLNVSYGAIAALREVSIKVQDKEIVCVLGPNGAGKTTLLKAISGQVKAQKGSIEFDGVQLHRMSPIKVVRAGVIHCPEGRQLFNTLSVKENIQLGAARLGTTFKHLNDDLDFIMSLFPIIRERWQQKAGTLSGGEQQMVALARSIAGRPRLLLLDEPALGLAPKLVSQLFTTIPLIAGHGMSIILVEQNARAALRVAHRGYVLGAGQIKKVGDKEDIQQYLDEHASYAH